MAIRFTNTKRFESDLETISRETGVRLDTLLRSTAIRIFRGFVERTPVDTGYARANWNVAPDNPNFSTSPPGIIGDPLSNFELPQGATRIFITNSVPYIIYLEQGRTRQLEEGKGFMVQRTLAQITDAIEAEARRLSKESML